MNKKVIALPVFTAVQFWAAALAHAVVKTNYGFAITGFDAPTKPYTVFIKQLPTTNADETCATFRHTSPTEITFVGLCADEGSDWFYGTYGQTFDNACTIGVADCVFAFDEGGIAIGEPASVAGPPRDKGMVLSRNDSVATPRHRHRRTW